MGALSAEDAITHTLLRWQEPVSRHARQIAQAALTALDGNGFPIRAREWKTRTTLGGQPSIDTSYENGMWVLRLPCLCCGKGEISITLTPTQARDLGELFKDEPEEARDVMA